jgi:hypothetical protein
VATLSGWLRDWRNIAENVPVGNYEEITVELDGTTYEIMRISAFDQEIDGDRRAVRTGARIFDDKTALYTHLTRDTGVVRFITMRGSPTYVLEPGADVIEWAAAVEGISVREMAAAVREGALGKKVARLVKRGQRHAREVLVAQVTGLQQRAEDAEHEVAMLRLELRARERDLAVADRD